MTTSSRSRPTEMHSFATSPKQLFAGLWQNRVLVKSSIRHEILGRYKGSLIGIMWAFLVPLFMLSVYTIVFGEIFKARWASHSSSKAEFALLLFAGLILFNLFSECVSRAPNLILNNPNYVKKVIYPLEILPWVALGTALFHAVISFMVWVAAYTILIAVPHFTIIFMPLILLPLIFFILGISWALASLGVFIRDVPQFIGIVLTAMMFLSPIFYPATAIPESYRFLIYLNPLTAIIEQARDVMYWGHLPNFKLLSGYILFTSTVAWMGFLWFQKTRKGFADVI